MVLRLPKDAIHVATALHLNADALETFDANLIGKSGTVGDPLLKIREPQAAKQGRRFLPDQRETQAKKCWRLARGLELDEC